MISYNNSDIIQCLRQYDMFANSLKLVYSEDEKKKIVNQLDKLLEKSLKLTNEIYEEEYNALVNKETSLLDEEKTRLTLLIELINQRISYVERQCQDHYIVTGERIDCPYSIMTQRICLTEPKPHSVQDVTRLIQETLKRQQYTLTAFQL